MKKKNQVAVVVLMLVLVSALFIVPKVKETISSFSDVKKTAAWEGGYKGLNSMVGQMFQFPKSQSNSTYWIVENANLDQITTKKMTKAAEFSIGKNEDSDMAAEWKEAIEYAKDHATLTYDKGLFTDAEPKYVLIKLEKDWTAVPNDRLLTSFEGSDSDNYSKESNLGSDGTVLDIASPFLYGSLAIPNGVSIILDLNGHTLDRALPENTALATVAEVKGNTLQGTLNKVAIPSVISVGKRARLEIFDSTLKEDENGEIVDANGKSLSDSTAQYGKITGGHSDPAAGSKGNNHKGGGVHLYERAEAIFHSGVIEGNSANLGGGVYGLQNSNFSMFDGIIRKNKASKGGAVYEAQSSRLTFNMFGGRLENNQALVDGGGLCVYENAFFNLYGGIITGNTANKGGGIHVDKGSVVKLYNGNIEGNTANVGGGVHIAQTAEGIWVNGPVHITKNYQINKDKSGNDVADNLHLTGGSSGATAYNRIIVGGYLVQDKRRAEIWVTPGEMATVNPDGTFKDGDIAGPFRWGEEKNKPTSDYKLNAQVDEFGWRINNKEYLCGISPTIFFNGDGETALFWDGSDGVKDGTDGSIGSQTTNTTEDDAGKVIVVPNSSSPTIKANITWQYTEDGNNWIDVPRKSDGTLSTVELTYNGKDYINDIRFNFKEERYQRSYIINIKESLWTSASETTPVKEDSILSLLNGEDKLKDAGNYEFQINSEKDFLKYDEREKQSLIDLKYTIDGVGFLKVNVNPIKLNVNIPEMDENDLTYGAISYDELIKKIKNNTTDNILESDDKTKVYSLKIQKQTKEETWEDIDTSSEYLKAGTYRITTTKAEEYNNNYQYNASSKTFTISQRPITVKIKDQSKEFDGENPKIKQALDEGYEIIDGDVLTGEKLNIEIKQALKIFNGSEEPQGNHVSTYALYGVDNDDNYEVKFATSSWDGSEYGIPTDFNKLSAGTYTISPRDVEIIIKNKTGVYGSSDGVATSDNYPKALKVGTLLTEEQNTDWAYAENSKEFVKKEDSSYLSFYLGEAIKTSEASVKEWSKTPYASSTREYPIIGKWAYNTDNPISTDYNVKFKGEWQKTTAENYNADSNTAGIFTIEKADIKLHDLISFSGPDGTVLQVKENNLTFAGDITFNDATATGFKLYYNNDLASVNDYKVTGSGINTAYTIKKGGAWKLHFKVQAPEHNDKEVEMAHNIHTGTVTITLITINDEGKYVTEYGSKPNDVVLNEINEKLYNDWFVSATYQEEGSGEAIDENSVYITKEWLKENTEITLSDAENSGSGYYNAKDYKVKTNCKNKNVSIKFVSGTDTDRVKITPKTIGIKYVDSATKQDVNVSANKTTIEYDAKNHIIAPYATGILNKVGESNPEIETLLPSKLYTYKDNNIGDTVDSVVTTGKYISIMGGEKEFKKAGQKLGTSIPESNYVYPTEVNPLEIEITKRPVTVKIKDESSYYGSDIKDINSSDYWTVEGTKGFIENEDRITLSIVDKANKAVTDNQDNNVLVAGKYSIIGTNNNENYDVTFINGTYTVEPRPLTLKWQTTEGKDYEKTAEFYYDGKNHALTISDENIIGPNNEVGIIPIDKGKYTITKSDNFVGDQAINSGTYTINLVLDSSIAANYQYNGTIRFIINKAENTFVEDYKRDSWKIGQEPTKETLPKPLYGTISKVTYCKDIDCEEEYTEEFTKDTPVGTYYVKVEVNEGDNYNYLSEVFSFLVLEDKSTVLDSLTAKLQVKSNTSYNFTEKDFKFKIVPDKNNPESDPIKETILTNSELLEDGYALIKLNHQVIYDEVGTYTYYISQIRPQDPEENMTYDDTIYRLVVIIGEPGEDGKYTLGVKYYQNQKELKEFIFVNEYNVQPEQPKNNNNTNSKPNSPNKEEMLNPDTDDLLLHWIFIILISIFGIGVIYELKRTQDNN